MAVRLFEAVRAKGVADAAKVRERSLLVEAKMLEGTWAMNNVLILGDRAEAPERAVLVEAKMLEHIWIFSDMVVLEDLVRVEVDVLRWEVDRGT